jgi:hypothetical protein
MSECFQKRSQEETLRRIQERLGQGVRPAAIIEEMMPPTREEAFPWSCRLAGWDAYRNCFPAQAIALARLISRRAMKEFRWMMREDGRVVERRAERKGWKTPKPAASFPLMVGGEEVRVEYTKEYFPNSGIDLVYFVSPHDPPSAHALSETGYFSRFVPHDAVEACGGPQAYAALLAEAILRSEEQRFIEAFEGPLPVTDERHCRQANRPEAAPGGHAERLRAEEEKTEKPHRQRLLFGGG